MRVNIAAGGDNRNLFHAGDGSYAPFLVMNNATFCSRKNIPFCVGFAIFAKLSKKYDSLLSNASWNKSTVFM